METNKPTVEQFNACVQAIQEHLKLLKEHDFSIKDDISRRDIDPDDGYVTIDLRDGSVFQECTAPYEDYCHVPVYMTEALAEDPLALILERTREIKAKREAAAAKQAEKERVARKKAKLAKEKEDRATYERLRKKFEELEQNT